MALLTPVGARSHDTSDELFRPRGIGHDHWEGSVRQVPTRGSDTGTPEGVVPPPLVFSIHVRKSSRVKPVSAKPFDGVGVDAKRVDRCGRITAVCHASGESGDCFLVLFASDFSIRQDVSLEGA